MYKLIGSGLFLAVIAMWWQLDVQLGAAEKVNIAFPPRAEVRIQLETLESLISSDDSSMESFKNAYESKLNLRALNCTQGIVISRLDSINSIKELPIDRDCLKQQDDQLQELIGSKLVGFRLNQPPLKPLVKLGPPSAIAGTDGIEISRGKSASKAGIAVLRGSRNEFISVEIPGGKKIASMPNMPEASHTNESISPNGRVLAIPVNNKDLRFVDIETGQDLWLVSDINQLYAWLPEIQAALVRDNKTGTGNGGLSLIDFKKGNIKPYSVSLKNQYWALNVSESPSRLLIGSYKDFSLLENTRTAEGVDATVLKEFRIKSPSANVSSLTPTLMLDGKAIVFVTGRDFMLFNLETREERWWESGLVIGNNYAKLSEDSILVDGHNLANPGGTKPFIFNIRNSTLSPVETAEADQGIIYELNGRTGFMRRGYQKVWVGDELQSGKAESLDVLIEGRRLERQLQALEREERLSKARLEALKSAQDVSQMQRQVYPRKTFTIKQDELKEFLRREAEQGRYMDMRRVSPALRTYLESPAAEAPAPMAPAPMAPAMEYPAPAKLTDMYSASANAIRKQEISDTKNRMLGDIPANARVEAVGVYETKDRSAAGINVTVKKSDQPIVLLLSAYEPVKWNLIKEPGANLAAVIATGYNLPQVTGTGATKVVVKRGSYAYQQNSPEYAALNNEAMMWAGKPIGRFQGTYRGNAFVVGN